MNKIFSETIRHEGARREYTIHQTTVCEGLWQAYFYPINQKTGRPWQASRRVMEGENAYVLVRYGRNSFGPAIERHEGIPPSFEEVTAAGWDSFCTGFSSYAKALEAVNRSIEARLENNSKQTTSV